MNGRKRYALAPVCLILLLAATVSAASPPDEVVVNSADPDFALQGSVALDIEVGGDGFQNGAQVRFFVTGTEDPGGIIVTNVKVRGPKKLTATIDVDAGATVDDFDIEVEVLGGRKGKGTTLFRVQENKNLPDRISGCVEFAPGFPITTDGGVAPDFDPTYCDGEPYDENVIGEPGIMQVAMNCKFDQFNLTPGGGSRRIELDVSPNLLPTQVTSCENNSNVVNVEFRDTGMGNVPDCTDTPDPDWAFDQVMRTSTGDVNVCELEFGQTTTRNMRFQSNLFYRRDKRIPECKGGRNKCGYWWEGIEVNYDDADLCPPVTVSCTGTDADGLCSTWIVAADGAGCVTHGSGSAPIPVSLPFRARFTACPNNDCGQ